MVGLIQDEKSASDADRARAASRAFEQAEALRAQGTPESLRAAIEKYEEGLRIRRPLGDRRGEAATRNLIGVIWNQLGERRLAINSFDQALQISRQINDRAGQATALVYLGVVNSDLGERRLALDQFRQAHKLWRELGDELKEADTLINLGALYRDLGDKRKALDCFDQALTIRQKTNDRTGQETALTNLGAVYSDLGQRQRALEHFDQAVALWRAANDARGEAAALNNIGVVHSQLGEKRRALDFFERALALRRQLPGRRDEATTLHNLGVVYSDLDDKRRALEYFDRALELRRAVGDRAGQAATLNNLGVVYAALGDRQRALDFYNQSLPLRRATGDRNGEAYTTSNLGAIYSARGEKRPALDQFNRALDLWRATSDRSGQALALTNIGVIRSDLGERQEAINLFNQALALRRQIGDRNGEAAALNNLGFAHALLGDRQKALDHLDQALAIFRALQSQEGEGATLHHLTLVWKTFGEPQLAIFYGKLAVNVYQAMRANLRPLSKELQQSFLKSREEIYRELADLLIEEGRLAEAQQVIGLLKEEEYFEFIRRDVQAAPSLPTRAEMTAEEARLLDEYKRLADRVTAIGVEISALEAKLDRAPEEERRLAELATQRATANQFFQQFLNRLSQELEKTKQAATIKHLRESQDMDQTLKELGAGAAAIYTLVTEKRYRVILVTPYSRKAAESKIKASDLNRKALEFREALRDPRVDPRPLGQELYKILVAPIAKDLADARAQTLLWSLDGALRYLPVAALHDGEKYLVESYSNIVVTLANLGNLKEPSQPQWKGLGMGVSKSQGGFRPLPAVPEELRAVIRDESNVAAPAATSGVLPGRLLLDEQFTEAAMRESLRQRYPLVHIASHFRFHPGNETDSFLLLGDGAQLTLARIKAESNLFAGVELLALSACNTAMSGEDAEGKEIEGFGVMAQRQGAKAVVATLWSVADASTRELMRRFYQLRQSQPQMSKAEALRQAQLALLGGEQYRAREQAVRQRDVRLDKARAASGESPAFQPDPKAPYAHPFYWAPFILIGNWK